MSLQRIAEISNVSVATVSRVINSRSGPSPKTVRVVRDVMEQLGYTPPPPSMRIGRPIQKPIKGTRTGVFATLLFDFDLTIENGLFADLIRSVSKELSANGYTMVLDSVSNASKVPACVASSKVDGILCAGCFGFNQDIAQRYSHIPTVWMMHSYGGWGDHVLPDSELVGKKAADIFYSKGHKNVAFMEGRKLEIDDLFRIRCASFEKIAKSLGLNVSTFSTEYIYPERFAHNKMDFMNSIHRAYKMFVEEFVELNPLPTAIFCPSDDEVAVLYKYLKERSVVPGVDVEVIGCNNSIEQIASLDPIPTTFDLNIDTVAKRAVEQLLWRVDNPTAKGTTKILVEPHTVSNQNFELTYNKT